MSGRERIRVVSFALRVVVVGWDFVRLWVVKDVSIEERCVCIYMCVY